MESTVGGLNIDKYLLDKVKGLQTASTSDNHISLLQARKLKHALVPSRLMESNDLENDDNVSSSTTIPHQLYELPDGGRISLESELSSSVLDELINPQHDVFRSSNNDDDDIDSTGRGIIEHGKHTLVTVVYTIL